MTQKSSNTINKTILSNRLSVQVSLTGLSFLIQDNQTKAISFFKTINFDSELNPLEIYKEIEKAYLHHDVLKQDFEEVAVVYSNPLYTLVPMALYDEKSAAEYLKFNTKILHNDFIAEDRLENFDLVNLFVPYTNINNFFFDHHGAFTYKHVSSVLIQTLLAEEAMDQNHNLYLNVTEGYFDLLVTQNRKLLLCNSFKYSTKEDLIYHLLFTAEQLKLNPETFRLILLGNINKDDENYKMLYKYVREIDFYYSKKEFALDPLVNTIDFGTTHQHFAIKHLN